MGRNNICVIYDSDENYAKRLMKIINDDVCLPYNAQVFTKKEELKQYLSNGQADMLMINEEAYEYGSILSNERTVVLCEDEDEANQINDANMESVVGVCKYQPSYQILQSVMHYEKKERTDSFRVKIVGVYGVNNTDRTLLSLGIARFLSNKRQTLLITLEEFSPINSILKCNNGDTLSDAFYTYKQNHMQFHKNMENVVLHIDRLDYIPGVICADDISEMDTDVVRDMIGSMGRELGYYYVVVDIGSGVRKSWDFLGCCDAVYMPEGNNFMEKLRTKSLEQYFLQRGMENIYDSIEKISVVYDEKQYKDDIWQNIEYSDMYEHIQRKVVI